ncbi:MAG TPA: LytTR family DNA-binding domain-containing protein [Draconibacterium sp.]|nr:LytTR family DNA-binding domain-containing protein [Draconibacterium sp.]
MTLNCLIVDDEPLSQEIITDYVSVCPELNLKGVCKNALEAGELLNTFKIDVLFLDINMPILSGIGFVKSLKEKPLFVFVTAFPEHAIAGFDVDAVDYLLKPVSFERFRIAVNRVLERFATKENSGSALQHIMVRADKKNYKVDFGELLFLEAQGDYVKFVSAERTIMVHGTLKEFIAQLPEKYFEQIHKSYVISLSKVDYVEGNQVKVGNYKLPVSLSFKEQFLKKLG